MKKKNQHFVPQFYFRFFSADGKSISLIKKKDGECKSVAPIRSQSSGSFFYGSVDVEDALSKLEGQLKSVLAKMKDCKNLKDFLPDERLLVFIAIVFQHERTLAARTKMQPAYNHLMRLFAEMEIGKDDSLSEEEKENLISSLNLLEIDAVRPQLETMVHTMQNAHLLSDLLPVVLENKTNRPFFFGDAPVVLHNAYYGDVKHQGVLGYASSGLQIIYPLSEKRTLMFVDNKTYKVKGVYKDHFVNIKNLKDIEVINRLQFLSASSTVYFSDPKYNSYAEYVWSLDKDKASYSEVKIVEAMACCDDGVTKEIIHSFVPLLPIKFRLSFLEHEVLSDGNYVPSIRESCEIDDEI